MSKIFIGDGSFNHENACEVIFCNNFPISKDTNGNFMISCIGHELFLFKYCNEYNYTKRLLSLNNFDELEDYILFNIIKHLEFDEFTEALTNIEQRGFDEGYKKAQKNIRESLGINI